MKWHEVSFVNCGNCEVSCDAPELWYETPPRDNNIRAMIDATYDSKSAPQSDSITSKFAGWYEVRVVGRGAKNIHAV